MQPIRFWNITINTKCKKKCPYIITKIWHRAKCNFTSINNTWYTWVMYQIWTNSPHSSPSYQQTLTIYGEIAKLSQIWHRAKWNYILCASVAHGTWSWYQIWRKSIQPYWRNMRGQANEWMDRPDPFLYSLIPLLLSENNILLIIYI